MEHIDTSKNDVIHIPRQTGEQGQPQTIHAALPLATSVIQLPKPSFNPPPVIGVTIASINPTTPSLPKPAVIKLQGKENRHISVPPQVVKVGAARPSSPPLTPPLPATPPSPSVIKLPGRAAPTTAQTKVVRVGNEKTTGPGAGANTDAASKAKSPRKQIIQLPPQSSDSDAPKFVRVRNRIQRSQSRSNSSDVAKAPKKADRKNSSNSQKKENEEKEEKKSSGGLKKERREQKDDIQSKPKATPATPKANSNSKLKPEPNPLPVSTIQLDNPASDAKPILRVKANSEAKTKSPQSRDGKDPKTPVVPISRVTVLPGKNTSGIKQMTRSPAVVHVPKRTNSGSSELGTTLDQSGIVRVVDLVRTPNVIQVGKDGPLQLVKAKATNGNSQQQPTNHPDVLRNRVISLSPKPERKPEIVMVPGLDA